MVSYKLVDRKEDILVYEYYPENHLNSKPGIITVDFTKSSIHIDKMAEEDFEFDITIEERNAMIEEINDMKRERGETDFLELATKPIHVIQYGHHAVSDITKQINQDVIPEDGNVMWY